MLRQISKFMVQSSWFIVSGILLALPFNHGKLWFLSWFGFVPLFIALGNKSKAKAFLLSFITGVVFWSVTIYWLVHVTLTGTILLILYLALYFGFFGVMFSTLNHEPSSMNFIYIPSSWVILEYLRSHLLTGFPWALLGYSQYLNLPIIQISDITGVWGVSFLVMMSNVAAYSLIIHRSSLSVKKRGFLLSALLIMFTLIYGYYKIRQTTHNKYQTEVKISVVQGNIPQELKWNPLSRSYIVNKYLDISKQAAEDTPDLIIWPEASLPAVLEEEPVFFASVKDLAIETKTPLLLGALTTRNNLYYNSALLVSTRGEILSQYDKLHLVPFGEYIPLRKTLSFMETIAPIGDVERGKDYAIFSLPAKFSVLICFEDLFPQISREFIKRGADFLVNITNDAWYKKTPASFQHFQASVFRAVENRVFLVRAANTGVSGFIGPSGKIISLVRDKTGQNIFIDGFDTQTVSVAKRPFSFYTRYGDVLPVVCIFFVIYGIILRHPKK